MKEQVKRIKMDVIVTAFVCIGLGIVRHCGRLK